MSEVLMIPDGNRNGNNSQFDPNLLLATMFNGNGGFGGNGNWLWVIFLFFLFPFMRGNWGGNGNGGGSNGFNGFLNSFDATAGRELLQQAIAGNRDAISQLAAMLSTSTDFVQQAICGVDKSIATLSGQVGLSGQQIINSVQQGNMQLSSQLASCCCDVREAITRANYENQISTLNQTNVLQSGQNFINRSIERGFADTAYATRDQTCQLGNMIQNSTRAITDTTTAQTASIIGKLDAMEKTSLQNKIDMLREANSNLKTQINFEHQNAYTQSAIAAAVAPINAQLAEIKCAQPNTVTVPYYPFHIIPNCGYQNNYNGGCGNQFWF